ncbi:MAG: ABC transporter substrate-binding protein [Clostridiales bacterium]|nr:ABC transporter substrate-binding protein [Clostridiales bacterium]
MDKKRFIPVIIIIVLLIACVILSIVLFGCAPWQNAGNAGAGIGSGTGLTGGSDQDGEEEELPPAVIDEWDLPIVVSITGPDSDLGLAAAWGFDYGVKSVNEQGGIRGVQAKTSVHDAASSESKVISEIGTIAGSAMIVMGPPDEALFRAGEQAFYTAELPAVGAATDVANRVAYQPFAISCIDEPGSAVVSAVTSWVQSEQFEKVWVICSPATSERTDIAEAAFIEKGKEVVQKTALGSEVFDAASVAEEVLSSDADAYYLDLSGEDTLRIVKQLKYLANDTTGKLTILCGPLAADQALIENLEEGEMLGVQVWSVVDPVKDAEKRKAFDVAFENNVGDPEYYGIAVDYYQAALTIKQAIDALGLTGEESKLTAERVKLAEYLYDMSVVSTDHGDLVIVSGGKQTAARLYKITEKGFQS